MSHESTDEYDRVTEMCAGTQNRFVANAGVDVDDVLPIPVLNFHSFDGSEPIPPGSASPIPGGYWNPTRQLSPEEFVAEAMEMDAETTKENRRRQGLPEDLDDDSVLPLPGTMSAVIVGNRAEATRRRIAFESTDYYSPGATSRAEQAEAEDTLEIPALNYRELSRSRRG